MTTVIVEDEGLAARNLQTILEEIGPIQMVATLESIAETVEWFQLHPQPDLLFLDIHLADGSAFEIFDQINSRFYPVPKSFKELLYFSPSLSRN